LDILYISFVQQNVPIIPSQSETVKTNKECYHQAKQELAENYFDESEIFQMYQSKEVLLKLQVNMLNA
jgi:hypothetical protein